MMPSGRAARVDGCRHKPSPGQQQQQRRRRRWRQYRARRIALAARSLARPRCLHVRPQQTVPLRTPHRPLPVPAHPADRIRRRRRRRRGAMVLHETELQIDLQRSGDRARTIPVERVPIPAHHCRSPDRIHIHTHHWPSTVEAIA